MSGFEICILVACIIIGFAPVWWAIDDWLFRHDMRKSGWKDEWGWK